MSSQRRIGCVALLAVNCWLGWCGTADAGKIVLTGSDWPVWETARAMDQLGMSQGVSYEFRKYVHSISLFKFGKADAILINLYDYLVLCRDKKFAQDTVAILATDFSHGGDMVVTRPEITKAADLKGRRVGLDIESLSLYLLHLTLRQEGLTLGDVELAGVKGEHIDKAFAKSKALSAVVGWNPYASATIEKGGRKLSDSAAFPGQIVDVMVVWRSSLHNSRRAYRDFLKAWFEARRSPKVLAKMAELNGVDVDEFTAWLGEAKTFDTPQDALRAMSEATVAIESIEHFLENNRHAVPDAIKQSFVPREYGGTLLDTSLLEELIP